MGRSGKSERRTDAFFLPFVYAQKRGRAHARARDRGNFVRVYARRACIFPLTGSRSILRDRFSAWIYDAMARWKTVNATDSMENRATRALRNPRDTHPPLLLPTLERRSASHAGIV